MFQVINTGTTTYYLNRYNNPIIEVKLCPYYREESELVKVKLTKE